MGRTVLVFRRERDLGGPQDIEFAITGGRLFVDRFRKARPDWDIDEMDLWREQLPEFTGAMLDAKYARMDGRGFTSTSTSLTARKSQASGT